jgi:hypothetical protein
MWPEFLILQFLMGKLMKVVVGLRQLDALAVVLSFPASRATASKTYVQQSRAFKS